MGLAPQKLKKTPVSRRSLPSKAYKKDIPLISLENDDSSLDTEPESVEASVEPTEENVVDDSIENKENVDTESDIDEESNENNEVLTSVNITSSRRSLAPQTSKKTPVSRRSLPSKAFK